MTTPIRITYRENLQHYIEAQSQSPPPLGKQVSQKGQRRIMRVVVAGAVIYALVSLYREKHDLKLVFFCGAFMVVIGTFWFLLFKKLGMYKTTNYQDYRWTKRDRQRFEKYYRKKGGDEAATVTCELGESGVQFNPGQAKAKAYAWNEIIKVIERPKGLFVYIKSWMYLWLPREAFVSQEDFQSALNLANAHVKTEKLNLPDMAFVALGTNLGDRGENILKAFQSLREVSDYPMLKSSLWETTPVDCPPGSPLFLNAVVALTPKAGEMPESLLVKLLKIEKEFGRAPKKILNEARPLDLDLIAFGNEVRSTPELTLPHPRAHLRQFVLQPLAEIAPDLVLAGQGDTVAKLLSQLTSDEVVRKLP